MQLAAFSLTLLFGYYCLLWSGRALRKILTTLKYTLKNEKTPMRCWRVNYFSLCSLRVAMQPWSQRSFERRNWFAPSIATNQFGTALLVYFGFSAFKVVAPFPLHGLKILKNKF